MQITLSQEQSQILETLVKSGQYPSLELAIDKALLFLIDETVLPDVEQEPSYLAWIETTRQKIEVAQAQVRRGEVFKIEDVVAELRRKVQQAREAAS